MCELRHDLLQARESPGARHLTPADVERELPEVHQPTRVHLTQVPQLLGPLHRGEEAQAGHALQVRQAHLEVCEGAIEPDGRVRDHERPDSQRVRRRVFLREDHLEEVSGNRNVVFPDQLSQESGLALVNYTIFIQHI